MPALDMHLDDPMSRARYNSLLVASLASAALALSGCGSDPEREPPPDAPTIEVARGEAPPPPAPVAPPPAAPIVDPATTITSGEDITVESVKRISERTFDIMVSTPNVSPRAKMTAGNGIRITLPPDYATSGKRYPVLYFLHGGTCNYTSNFEGVGIEQKTTGANADVIVVLPEGGELGFYTDWVDQSIAQKWATYHLTQLIPFIDRNLRTIASKEGRAIGGISMGGLGAMRYATDRPDLFSSVTSISGIIDLENAAIQTGIIAVLAASRINVAGPFGPPIVGEWHKLNPASPARAKKLADVQTFMYVGEGTDPVELSTVNAANVMRNVLSGETIPFFYLNYGSPGDTPEGPCNGGHGMSCSKYAFADAMPRIMGTLAGAR